jgi:hypothetical protein
MNNNNEDNIRLPDDVKIDRLIDNNFYSDFYNEGINHIKNPIWDADHDLNKAIEISKNEFNLTQEQQQKERENKFRHVKTQLNKILLFDRPNLRYYELILTIIEMYECSIIIEYKTYETEYINIFKLLKTIRLPIEEIEDLKKLIICE